MNTPPGAHSSTNTTDPDASSTDAAKGSNGKSKSPTALEEAAALAVDRGGLPRLGPAGDGAAYAAALAALRRFHVSGEAGELESIGDGYLPALLDPYRSVGRVRKFRTSR